MKSFLNKKLVIAATLVVTLGAAAVAVAATQSLPGAVRPPIWAMSPADSASRRVR